MCAANRCPIGSATIEFCTVMFLAPTASMSSRLANSTDTWSKIMTLALARARLALPFAGSSVPSRKRT
ncbi:hypothetical protein BIV23_25205 [Streptomyces monashensis]|uniref:Uncharacterized protein n=1 Tax=Streptomyces monashensis TaxID=1678012 RepID=A0A1S2Q7P4_9ACTN|nr:hypothetical protein BIV23_25205 [Streptomyces monashensis]